MFATIILIIMQCFILVVFLSSCTTPKHLGHTKRNRPENRCRQKASLKKKKEVFFSRTVITVKKRKMPPKINRRIFVPLLPHVCIHISA